MYSKIEPISKRDTHKSEDHRRTPTVESHLEHRIEADSRSIEDCPHGPISFIYGGVWVLAQGAYSKKFDALEAST